MSTVPTGYCHVCVYKTAKIVEKKVQVPELEFFKKMKYPATSRLVAGYFRGRPPLDKLPTSGQPYLIGFLQEWSSIRFCGFFLLNRVVTA